MSTADHCDSASLSRGEWELDAIARLVELFHEAVGQSFVEDLVAALASSAAKKSACLHKNTER